MKRNTKGFTLVELLVVVSIIAILSAIGVVAFSNAQAQGRDTKRRADIDSLAKSFEARKGPGSIPGYPGRMMYFLAFYFQDFPNDITPRDPFDPDRFYCISVNNDLYSPPAARTSAWPDSSCPTTTAPEPPWGQITEGTNNTVHAWTICANLETEGPYCRSSTLR